MGQPAVVSRKEDCAGKRHDATEWDSGRYMRASRSRMAAHDDIREVLAAAGEPLTPKEIAESLRQAGRERTDSYIRNSLQVHCVEQMSGTKRAEPYFFKSVGGGKWTIGDAVAVAPPPDPPAESEDPGERSARMLQILKVLAHVRDRSPTNAQEIASSRRAATVAVAAELGFNERSVADKCWRGLDLSSIDQFDDLTAGWLLRGDGQLRALLESRATRGSKERDLAAIAEFFDGLRDSQPETSPEWLQLVDDCRVRVEDWDGRTSLLVNSVGGGTVRTRGVALLLRQLANSEFELHSVGYHPSGKPFLALSQVPTRDRMREHGDESAREIFRALGRIEGGNQGSRFRVALTGGDVPQVREWLARLAGGNVVVPPVSPTPPPVSALKDAVPAIHAALLAAGWVYEPWQIAAYITALRTKPFIILGGVSGTGKSELPGLINEIVGGAPRTRISVRPDWTDSSDLLGYRDLKREFRPGDLALAAQAASEDSKRFHVCVVDEMNIARVEHYFAEVLSAIEDRGAADGGSGTLLSAHLAEDDAAWANLRIPRNLALVGTVNMDESTFGFSKKVLDRAFTIELSSVDLGRWRRGASGTLGSVPMDIADLTRARRRLSDLSAAPETVAKRIDDIIRNLGEVNTILTPAQLHLGYRSRDEIVLFVLNAEEVSDAFRSADGTPVDPLDLALMMKVLPRIAGGSRTVRASLAQLLCWACSRAERASSEEAATTIRDEWVAADRPVVLTGKRFPRSAARLCLMWDRMAEEGFTSFWV